MSLLIATHVVAGTLSFVAGLVALVAPKGGPLHRGAGRVFAVAMIVTAASGAWHALGISQAITVIAGVFTVYLVVTAYVAARVSLVGSGGFEIMSALFAAGLAAVSIRLALEAQASIDGAKDGFGPGPYFFFGGVAIVAAIGDVVTLLRRNRAAHHRIARHLWRMGFALYIAAGSLLDGPGATAFPEWLRGTSWLTAPVELIGLMVAGWWIFTLVARRFRAAEVG